MSFSPTVRPSSSALFSLPCIVALFLQDLLVGVIATLGTTEVLTVGSCYNNTPTVQIAFSAVLIVGSYLCLCLQ